MRSSRPSRRRIGALKKTAALLGAVVGFVLASAGPASALTSSQADAIALTTLGTTNLIGNVALFGEPAPLPAGTVVGAWSLSARGGAMPTVTLSAPAWLFWEDDIYGAQFAHPSRILLLDDATGQVVSEMSLDMWPLLRPGPPPFAPGRPGYTSSNYLVYSSVSLVPAAGHRAADPSRAVARVASERITKADLKHQCLITIGDRGPSAPNNSEGDPRFAADLNAMDDWAQKAGLAHRDAPSSLQGLKQTMYEEVLAGCDDVLLYVAGHGLPPAASAVDGHKLHYGPVSFTVAQPSATPGVVISSNLPPTFNGLPVQPVTTTLDPKDISDLIDVFSDGGEITIHGKTRTIKKNPKFKLKLKLQSCFSGWFRDSLFKLRDITPGEGKPGPLAVVETSSSATEPSYFHIPEFEVVVGRRPIKTAVKTSTTKNPGISEATYANVYGLNRWLEDPGSGPRTLEVALGKAFTHAVAQDFSRTLGLTHPQVEGPGIPTQGGADNEPDDRMIPEQGPPRGSQGGSGSGGGPTGGSQGGTPPPTDHFCTNTPPPLNCAAWVQGSDLYETGLAINDVALSQFSMALPSGTVITSVSGGGCTFSGADISCPAPNGYQSIIITTQQTLQPIAHATLTYDYPGNPPTQFSISLTNCSQTLCP